MCKHICVFATRNNNSRCYVEKSPILRLLTSLLYLTSPLYLYGTYFQFHKFKGLYKCPTLVARLKIKFFKFSKDRTHLLTQTRLTFNISRLVVGKAAAFVDNWNGLILFASFPSLPSKQTRSLKQTLSKAAFASAQVLQRLFASGRSQRWYPDPRFVEVSIAERLPLAAHDLFKSEVVKRVLLATAPRATWAVRSPVKRRGRLSVCISCRKKIPISI